MGNVLVTGAGGMIGGHLVWDLLDDGHHVLAVDVKPLGEWWQAERWAAHPGAGDLLVCGRYDLSDPRQARGAVDHAVRRSDDPLWIYHLAADMGGIGFIEENRAACARSVVMNVAVLDAAAAHGDRVGRLFYSSSACFTAGAPVLTRDGVRPIEEIREGDEVLTHRGRWRRVTGTTANPYLGPLVRVRPAGRPAVTCTADHRLLSNHGEWVEAQTAVEVVSAVVPGGEEPVFPLGPVDRLRAAFTEVEDGVRPLDAVRRRYGMSPNTVTKMGQGVLPRRCDPVGVEEAPKDWQVGWLMGLWLAEGWVERSAAVNGQRRIVFAFDDGEDVLLDGMTEVLRSRFGVPADRVVRYDVPGQRGFKVHVTSERLASLMESVFYPAEGPRGARHKTLRRPVFDAPAEFRAGLLAGWWTGDGSALVREDRSTRWIWSTSSWALAHGARALLDSLGVATSMQVREPHVSVIDGREVRGKESFHIYTLARSSEVAAVILAGGVPEPGAPGVTAVAVTAPVDGAAMVYNLHVEEDHSYVVDGFVAHNCVYPAGLQRDAGVTALAEDDAYPAEPEAGYGEEKLFTESLCRYYREDMGVPTRIARFHNIYGTWGTWTGGREKAPAAICRKVAEAVVSGRHEIEVWGDGEQTRSFCWVGDCVEGTRRLAASDVEVPVNIGSDELVTVNELISVVEEVAGVRLGRHYLLDAPKGVRGRNSDNTRCRSVLGWAPGTSLADGMEVLYRWVFEEVRAAAG